MAGRRGQQWPPHGGRAPGPCSQAGSHLYSSTPPGAAPPRCLLTQDPGVPSQHPSPSSTSQPLPQETALRLPWRAEHEPQGLLFITQGTVASSAPTPLPTSSPRARCPHLTLQRPTDQAPVVCCGRVGSALRRGLLWERGCPRNDPAWSLLRPPECSHTTHHPTKGTHGHSATWGELARSLMLICDPTAL